MFLANSIHPLLFIVIILAFFGLIALIVFILRKHLPNLRDDGEKPVSKEEAAKEAAKEATEEANIRAIKNMLRFGVNKEQILTEYGEELYNLAVNSAK